MKKRAIIILTFIVGASLFSACGNSDNTKKEDVRISVETASADSTQSIGSIVQDQEEISKASSSEAEVSEAGSFEEKSAAEKVTVEEQTLVSEEGITIDLKSYDENGFWGPEFLLEITNQTSQNVTVSARDVSVNGIMIDPFFAEEIAAGKAVNSSMSVFGSDLEKAGIETIQEVEMTFSIYDTDSWEDLFETDPITVQTSASGTFEQVYNDQGTELYKDDRFRIVAQKIDSEDSFWGADIYLYIENNSDKKVMVSAENVSVNGYMIDPAFVAEITPGKKSFTTITFFESDLEENGIESIDEMEISFSIMDDDTWDDILDTDPITVKFSA